MPRRRVCIEVLQPITDISERLRTTTNRYGRISPPLPVRGEPW
jgi:hypothetical protein